MTLKMDVVDEYTKPYIRVLIMLIALLAAFLISLKFTGSPLPKDEKHILVFQNALLLVVLGSAVLEHFFTKPADSMINSLMAGITLIGVYSVSQSSIWWLIFTYCAVVFAISALCVSTSGARNGGEAVTAINSRLYRPAVVLGKARLIYSIVFLFGIYSFYSVQSQHAVVLIVFWGVFMAIWPLRLPQILSAIRFGSVDVAVPIGKLLRVDSPGILRFAITQEVDWDNGKPLLYQRLDKSQQWVQPLYSHFNDQKRVGTAIVLGESEHNLSGLSVGNIYAPEVTIENDEALTLLGEDGNARLLGFVAEDSLIGRIRFEVRRDANCADGMLVWCRIQGQKIYYQISAGTTLEEGIDGDKHGYQVAVASQLGMLDEHGFHKYDWLPNMNTPVFTLTVGTLTEEQTDVSESYFSYGCLPNSRIPVVGNFIENLNSHTAILGVTGSGKTELAFDMIRHAVGRGTKVICIDLTAQYERRLHDLNPVDLSIAPQTSADLGSRLFDVETGTYGAPEEKKALKTFSDQLRIDVDTNLRAFLSDAEPKLGLIQLQEISNSQASIFITEIYMSCLLNIAKENYGEAQRVLVVVEEAHTVMPESATMGVSDFASKGLIARISQIALQGRKYNVGLMILAQRTANVSKTVLTQCNSIISFACYDDTSISFLKNMFGSAMAEAIPNLKKLQAVVFGKIVNSERPIVVEIPHDPDKE
ncbi:MAG: DUF87 domain-containing protein [Porticoccaceae bacterium]